MMWVEAIQEETIQKPTFCSEFYCLPKNLTGMWHELQAFVTKNEAVAYFHIFEDIRILERQVTSNSLIN